MSMDMGTGLGIELGVCGWHCMGMGYGGELEDWE